MARTRAQRRRHSFWLGVAAVITLLVLLFARDVTRAAHNSLSPRRSENRSFAALASSLIAQENNLDLRLRYLGATGDDAGLLRLQQALALIHFKEYDKALEILRDARMTTVQGVSQGTLDYYTGVCLLHMGNVYLSETLQSFNQALKYPQATLFGPDGPLLAPLARQALVDLKP